MQFTRQPSFLSTVEVHFGICPVNSMFRRLDTTCSRTFSLDHRDYFSSGLTTRNSAASITLRSWITGRGASASERIWTSFARITAKYGSKMAPAKQIHINQPWTNIPRTRQTTRIVMAIVYRIMRLRRSNSGLMPTDVTFCTESFEDDLDILAP